MMRDETQAPPVPPVAAPTGYAHAAIPEPFRILGLRLRPFSLGHYLLMQRFSCGFLPDAGDPDRADLLLGVLICSMKYSDFLTFIEQKDFNRQINNWGRKIGLLNLEEKTALFQRYLQASLAEPDYIALTPSGEGGDWAQNLKMTLQTRLGFSEAEALDMPLSKALADYFRLAESEGLLRLITAEDRAAGESNAKALAAMAENKATEEAACPA